MNTPALAENLKSALERSTFGQLRPTLDKAEASTPMVETEAPLTTGSVWELLPNLSGIQNRDATRKTVGLRPSNTAVQDTLQSWARSAK